MNWSNALKNRELWIFIIPLISLLAGLILTCISWWEMCSNDCGAVHNYQFHGYPFELIGLIFFSTTLIVHSLSRLFPICRIITSLFLAGAVGAEVNFIGVQKFVVGQWCPICLAIAFCVGLAALIYLGEWLVPWSRVKKTNQGANMMFSQRAMFTVIVLIAGFIVSFFGVFQPEKSFAGGIASGNPGFGKKESPVEVYVVTDWFCAGCRKMDVHMRSDWPEIMTQAQVFFIDFPIHKETKNFIPYHLSFMIHNKDRYFAIRSALHNLADKTKKPKLKDIQNAIKPLGVAYQPLDFEDIDSGVRFFDGIIESFDVDATPTVIIANRKTLQSKKLEGTYSITKEAILKAIKEMQSSVQASSEMAIPRNT